MKIQTTEMTGRPARVQSPWRRYFARYFDLFLCTTLWSLVLLAFGGNIHDQGLGIDLLTLVVSLALLFLLEPLLLSRFGTTPGKAILGLSVTALDGGRLTYHGAYQRTLLVLIRGMGLQIPIYTWVRNYKSYDACVDGQALEWEQDSVLVLKDTRAWRIPALLALTLAVGIDLAAADFAVQPPHHKGDITVAEFCENYKDLAEYYDMDLLLSPRQDGTWEEAPEPENAVIITSPLRPVLTFQEADGVMTGLTYTLEGSWGDVMLSGYENHLTLAVLAFVRAQDAYAPGLWEDPLEDVLNDLALMNRQVDVTRFGVHITCVSETDDLGDHAGVHFQMEKAG